MDFYKFAFLYRSYKKRSIILLKIILLTASILFGVFNFFYFHNFPRLTIILISIVLFFEIYFRFYVERLMPTHKLSDPNAQSNLDYLTIPAYSNYQFDSSIPDLIKELIKYPACKFLLEKSNIDISGIEIIKIKKDEILNKARQIAPLVFGKYITRLDLLTAYLLLVNEKDNFLAKNHLKENDLLNILYWSRFNFPLEENPSPIKVVFLTEGIFDSITFGWTPITRNFVHDLTARVLYERPQVVGRKKEFKEMIDILAQSEHDNVLLIGEVGSGKTTLVEAFAFNSFLGNLISSLNHKRVYQLMIGQLIAGTHDISDLEERLEIVLEEIRHSGNIIIYIADLENLLGSTTYHTDLSSVLIPYLRSSHLPIIATSTTAAYKAYIEKEENFTSFFEVVRLDEPNRNEAIQMVMEKANYIERKNKVIFTFKAIVSSVDLAKRFMLQKALPGSAIALLESSTSSKVLDGKNIVDEENVEEKVEGLTHVSVTTPSAQEKNLLLNLEKFLHTRIIGQDEAIKAIAQALRRLRAGMINNTRPTSFLFLGPTGVGKTETAKALGDIYFKNQRQIIRLDMSEYKNADSVNRLLGSNPGEGSEKGELTEKVLDNPFSLILLDEFEKANPHVLDLFLQILEDGRLTDNKGRTVSFINTIIIATSNAGALYIDSKLKKGEKIDTEFKKDLISEIENENIFKIELLNRFDDIIIFTPLNKDDLVEITKIMLDNYKNKLKEQDINLTFDNSVIFYLADKGYEPEYGARPLRRLIEDELEDVIAKGILENKIESGSSIFVKANKSGLQVQD